MAERRSWRWLGRLAAGGGLAVVAFYGAGGWYFSGQLYQLGLSAKSHDPKPISYDLSISSVNGSELSLSLGANAPREATLGGTWGLQWRQGNAELVNLVHKGPSVAVWSYKMISGSLPTAGTKAAITTSVFPSNPGAGLGLAYSNVTYKGPLGRYPAWFVPAQGSTWAIVVHGNSMSRLDGIKLVPTLHQSGLAVLVITYRNDPGAPASPDGMLHYGQTEWEDLQAAVGYALGHGAKKVVLVGYSMGGGIVASFLEKSHLAPKVAGAVLDAPMLDFSATVNYGAREIDLPLLGIPIPASLTSVAKWLATLRFGINWRALDYLDSAQRLHTPILLFQGGADRVIPPSTSEALKQKLPHLVTYVEVPRAGHIQSWNIDPRRYDAQVKSFLLRVGA